MRDMHPEIFGQHHLSYNRKYYYFTVPFGKFKGQGVFAGDIGYWNYMKAAGALAGDANDELREVVNYFYPTVVTVREILSMDNEKEFSSHRRAMARLGITEITEEVVPQSKNAMEHNGLEVSYEESESESFDPVKIWEEENAWRYQEPKLVGKKKKTALSKKNLKKRKISKRKK